MPSGFPDWTPEGDTEETRRLFMRWLEGQEADFPNPPDDSWKQRLLDLVEEFVHPDVVLHNVPVRRPGRDGWVEFLMGLGEAYPDSNTNYDIIMVDGNMAAARWHYTATQMSDHFEHEASGKQVRVDGVMFERFENGKIVEHWAMIDRLGWLQQLGAVDESVRL